MSTHRLVYDDASSLAEMSGDCRAVGSRLDLPGQRLDRPVAEAPGAFLDRYRGQEHPTPLVSSALASRAADLELHFD